MGRGSEERQFGRLQTFMWDWKRQLKDIYEGKMEASAGSTYSDRCETRLIKIIAVVTMVKII